jgi:hypothetical protein
MAERKRTILMQSTLEFNGLVAHQTENDTSRITRPIGGTLNDGAPLADGKVGLDFSREIWRPIRGYEEFYQVSNMGRVRSHDRRIERPPKGPWLQKGRILKPGRNRDGYRTVALTDDCSRACFLVHRLVAYEFIPNPKNKPEVNHIDGTPGNDWVKNLEWATRREQCLHAIRVLRRWNRKGGGNGVDNHFHKLTEDQVNQIRFMLSCGESQKSIAAKFSVHFSTISCIKTRKSWAHL